MKKIIIFSTCLVIILCLTFLFLWTNNDDNSNLEKVKVADATITSRLYIGAKEKCLKLNNVVFCSII